MSRSSFFLAAMLIGAAAIPQPAAAQNGFDAPQRVVFGGWDTGFGPSASPAYAYIGGGAQFLSLPDLKFTGIETLGGGFRRLTDSSGDWLDVGGAIDGGFQHPLWWWGDYRVIGRLQGFWSNVEVGDTRRCTGGGTTFCGAFDPAGELGFVPVIGNIGGQPPTLVTKTDRDTDYWGSQASLIFGDVRPNKVKPNLYRNDFFIAGFDVRGIDQSNTLRGHEPGGFLFKYEETLDTTYSGGFIGLGGEYSFGFIPGLKNVGGLYDRLGIRTFVTLKGGLYNADTDYGGRFWTGANTTHLSQSDDELAFIGTVSLETRKQVGLRTSLSLFTDYEYISYVPQMNYADDNHPTRIDDDDIFASRTTLRLNIGLGPDELYTGRAYFSPEVTEY